MPTSQNALRKTLLAVGSHQKLKNPISHSQEHRSELPASQNRKLGYMNFFETSKSRKIREKMKSANVPSTHLAVSKKQDQDKKGGTSYGI